MKIKNILKYHKTTVVSILSTLLAAGLTYQWIKGDISFGDMCQYLTLIAGAVATLVGFLSPDGKNEAIRQENRESLIAEIKAQLKNETPKIDTDCHCGGTCTCKLQSQGSDRN